MNATRMSVAADGSTEANIYFLSLLRKKMQTSLIICHGCIPTPFAIYTKI